MWIYRWIQPYWLRWGHFPSEHETQMCRHEHISRQSGCTSTRMDKWHHIPPGFILYSAEFLRKVSETPDHVSKRVKGKGKNWFYQTSQIPFPLDNIWGSAINMLSSNLICFYTTCQSLFMEHLQRQLSLKRRLTSQWCCWSDQRTETGEASPRNSSTTNQAAVGWNCKNILA